ncbi:hypothetical protein [Stenotrophomonas sp. BIGb0135]|jgi:uncharacterized membrane protein YozB (DUF420 family)|uniref:Transmembrane protein n=1 Tax=Stenotrophomonas nematodicola TaxID=2656746 RepID=A0ABW7CT13_9GAMM|nr:hypothetical protein [Stenotrophomonas sp. BIGb0135]MCS4234689.1 uncharacterized membrane protein YozB (DUF420 family) [Stenotrophomonas sp. BIGb0135]
MTRWIGAFLYLSSLIAVLVTASHLSGVLALFPAASLTGPGGHLPLMTRFNAQWLPQSPLLLCGVGVATLLAALYVWRAQRGAPHRAFVLATLAALNYFSALFCSLMLLVTWFYLPRLMLPG